MTDGSAEHWLDRLAAGYTRRQVLRGALVGAALTVPFLRSGAARGGSSATGQQPCTRGCAYTAHRTAEAAVAACQAAPDVSSAVAFSQGYLWVGLGLFSLPLNYYERSRGAAAAQRCIDTALLQLKANYFDCLQPNCPGFDPKKAGGPCDTCSAQCCANPAEVDGYSCCDICSQSGGGCCYSVSGVC